MKRNILLILIALVLSPINVYAFQLDVTYGEDTYTIEAETADTIEVVKIKVQGETDVYEHNQVLRLGTTLLEDGRTLGDYNITEESTITLSLKKIVSKIEYTLTEPVEGATPDLTADVVMTIKDSNETIEMKDVLLTWYIRVDDDMEPISDVENYKFEDKEAYDNEIEFFTATKLRQEYDLNSGVEAEIINGVERTPNPPFVINGVKSIDIIIPTIYEGDALPSKIKVKITYAKETQELELDTTLWIKLTEDGQVYEEAVAGDLTEKGYLYYPGARIPDDIENLIDRHTVYLTNGKSYLDSAIKPVPRPSSGGAGESESIEVPETSDNVMTALTLSLISLIGIIGTSLLKNKITNEE